jgi:hypothetical protein
VRRFGDNTGRVALWANCRDGHIACAYGHKASHRRNSNLRIRRAAPRPFTAGCVSLDLIGA